MTSEFMTLRAGEDVARLAARLRPPGRLRRQQDERRATCLESGSFRSTRKCLRRMVVYVKTGPDAAFQARMIEIDAALVQQLIRTQFPSGRPSQCASR